MPITGAAILRDAHAGDITLADRQHVGQLAGSPAAAVLVPQDLTPSGKPMGGVTPMIQGAENDIHVDLPAGEYALICFAPDARDGKPHFAHGMVTQFAVR